MNTKRKPLFKRGYERLELPDKNVEVVLDSQQDRKSVV